MKHLLLFGFSLLLATHAALAGQVMVKSLPAVTNGNATHYAGTVDTALPFGFPPSSASTSPPSPANPGTVPGSAPGFRSVSNPTHTFITGWCDMPPAGASRPRDGFISKVDPTGAVIWTRSMNGLIGSTAGSVGFLINDVAILAPFLYACGQTTDGKAFVAKLDYDGVVQDYTLIRDNGGTATARATGVCVTIVSGSSQVAVSGDFGANNLIVDQRRMTGGTSTFGTMNGRYSHNSNRDVFVLRMDTSLNATWATTLGFSPANDYATAIAADGAGNLFVAMNFQNPDGALASLSYSNIDDERNVMVPGSSTTMTQTSTYNYDFNVGNWGTLVMINAQNGVGARIVHHSEPVKVDNSNNVNITNASSRIVDMEFSNGVINAVGEFSRNFRASSSANVNPSSGELFGSMSNTYDVFVAQLDPTNLNWTRFVFLASGNDDFAGQITAGSDGLYVTGSAGAALSHRVPGSTITTLSGATARHLFWTKLNSTNLSHMWHVTPVELISSGYSVPSVMNSAGIGVVGNVAVISGYYNGGEMTMGTTGSYTTLPAPGVPLGFTGFLKTDGTWFEQVNVTIQSDYGLPSPYGGTQVLATGTAVRATVPQIVYEDAAGNVLDDSDPEIIRRDAVTRRVCTGYQFKSSSVNGTANVVDFVVNDDVVLNFLWRTEHALEILTNLPAGLTSQAAGTPSPVVNKHWLAENSPVIAQIDGAAYTDQDGLRYRSSGYTATGLAVPQGWLDGAFVPWSSFQLRQQVPQFTLAGPATITWQWQKEFRLRVSANASLASSAPYVDGVPVSTTTIVPQSTTAYTATSVDGFPGPAGSSGFGNGWPIEEGPSMLNDGLATTKYLNFNKTAAGAILYYTAPITANRIRLTSANDAPERDPALIRIEGRNYVSGVAQPFQMIHTGLAIPAGPGRGVMQELAFDNTSSYKDYRVTFLAVQNNATATAVQVAELTFVNDTAAAAVTTTSAGPRLTGSGDFWAPPGTVLTAASAPSVSGGIGSLALKGYTGGTGSVVPFDTRGVTTKAITLNSPSTIIWDYARTIYPETVTIGNFVTFSTVTGIDATNVNKLKTPDGGVTLDVPANSTWMDMQQWDQVGQKLYPLRPGKFTVEFENLAAPEDVTQNVIVEVTAVWPGSTDYNHILEAPAVDVDPSDTDNRAFQKLAYTEAAATVTNAGLFSNTEEGRSVLLFSQRAAGVTATGNLTMESLSVKTVRSQFWKNAVGPKPNATIGTAITSPDHDINAVGHNGYVLTRLAPVNFGVYDLTTMQGPIIPVNIQYPPFGAWTAPDNPGMLAIAWYQLVDGLTWPYKAVAYDPQWPASPPRIVVASQLGTEGLKNSTGTTQDLFTGPQYNAVGVYNQPDPAQPGFNPNEEHALVAPSFLEPSRKAVFALRNDLNQTTPNANYTSSPYVLVNYRDDTDAANPVQKMAVYAIALQDAATTDARLPAFNQTYTFRYQGIAGTKLQPAYPLGIVIGSNPQEETDGINVDLFRITYYEDHHKVPWIVSGDTDADNDIAAVFYYALRGDFWHPTADVGDAIRFGPPSPTHNIAYNTIWPASTGFLKAGETLTFSGGEYASDHAGDTPAPLPLPGAVDWQSAKVIYDDANPVLDPATLATNYLVRVVPVLSAREVPLAVSAMPDSLKPASGNVIVEGNLWRFKKLNAGLQKRIYYNSITGKLGVRGYLNGRTLGDPDLTASPGAQTVLQPNILTSGEESILAGIETDTDWTSAVAALGALSRDPQNIPGLDYGVGLQPTVLSSTAPATAFGPGTAVITNPDLLDPAYQPSLSTGYVTIFENDDPLLGDAPVVAHVLRVTRSEVYRGSLAPIYPENVFDEKITVRHTGDFGGDVGDLFFEWQMREEDGRALNPPGINLPTAGTPAGGDWSIFASGAGLNEIQLAGASAALLSDNLFFCRYRHVNDSTWSQWAGAANSRPPNPSSPSASTDAAYVAQLVAGWVKRVTDAVNVFDARISDFRNNDAPATYTSMIQQAGQRYEGSVAFNPTKDVIENYGMIELYQTVLERAKDLSIDLAPGTSGINTALLNAANRISQFYTLIGNEAYSDALDPTIGYGTQSSQYGALAPTIHAFQNQTADLLDEELVLLRGRGEVGARPAYNRLLWNFTNGQGEAAYALNYAISDVDNDGFINANDAQRLYPQGHGDAWGHYTMALKGYADLFTNNRFSWDPRSELYQINGVVFNIDYLDERAFAETAASRAKAGAEIVDLVYRQRYTENPAGQWQGYQDTNTDRAWGVYEWGQRAATAAYFDWAVGNALLPSSDTTKEGIQRVDRSTVGGLGVLAANAALIQGKVESADRGYNPLGLDPNVVPFDIDPVRVDRTSVNPATHFEQIYERAVAAAGNAITTWDHANQLNNLLRRTGASTEQLRRQTKQQDLDYRNRLIELFGTPYAGTIGAGKAYPEGYQGPDLYLFPYVNTVEITEGVSVPRITTEIRAVIDGLLTLNKDSDPFLEGEQPLDANYHDVVQNWFSQDYVDTVATFGYTSLTLDLPVTTQGYAFKAPAGWGVRGSTGKIQVALAEMLQAELELLQQTEAYEGVGDDLKRLTRLFTAKTGIGTDEITARREALDEHESLESWMKGYELASAIIGNTREFVTETRESIKTAAPTSLSDFGAIVRGAVHIATEPVIMIARGLEVTSDRLARGYELDAERVLLDFESTQIALAYRSEALDLLEQIEAKVNTEPDIRLLVFRSIEKLRSAGERYRSLLAEGERLVEERIAFNQRVASTTTKQRYEDMTFRVTRNDALRKYRSAFDLASRYAYLAGKAYAYDLNLPDNHAANNTPLLADIIRTRDLGVWQNGQPVLAHGGLASKLATLKGNYDHFKGQMGFNNPSNQIYTFSLRADLGRVAMSTREDATWRQKLETWRVPDLWNYTHSDGTTNYGFIYRRFCRPFAAEFNGSGNPVPQPALVIPFTSTIQSGKNWFDNNLTAGDSALNSSEFATKIRAVGVRFDSYNTASLSVTPQVYLIPLGADRMFMPESTTLQTREWNVVDQRIPAPLPITPAQLSNPDWHPFTGSTSGYFDEIRKFSSFRAFPDSVGTTRDDIISSSRLVGRSAWNTKWVLIIPNASLLYDAASSTAGLNTFIHGLPKSGETQSSSGTDPAKRDLLGVRDIKLMIETYSVSGN